MKRVTAYIQIMRPLNCLMMGFAVIVGAVLANPDFTNFLWINALYGALTGFTLTAAAMAINDYYDRKIDAVNEPDRPIPSGLISSRSAVSFAGILTVIGLTFAYLTNIFCFAAGIIAWLIMMAYSTFGKRSGLLGNFLVSACVATPFIYGSIAVTNMVQTNVFLFAAMAFLSNTGREVTKGIVDVKGDKIQNIKTLAVRFGAHKAALAAVIFYITAVALSPVAYVLQLVSWLFIPFVLVTDIGLICCSLLLIRDYSRENARKIKKVVLFLFIFGLLAFIFGTVG